MNFKFGKFQFIGLILFILIISIVLWYPNTEHEQNKVIIAFGDSLTRGYGVTYPEKNYVVYLSEYIDIPIINAGKTGDTTSDALIRLKEDVLDKNPDIVILFLGGNDFFNGYSSEVIKTNLRAMVRKIHNVDAKIILIGGDAQIASEFEKTAQKIATEEEVFAFIPNILNGILFRKDLMFDAMHPNGKGHEIMAQKILPALQRALNEK